MNQQLLEAAKLCAMMTEISMAGVPNVAQIDPKQTDQNEMPRLVMTVAFFTEWWNFFFDPKVGALTNVAQPGGLLALPAGVPAPAAVTPANTASAPTTTTPLSQVFQAATSAVLGGLAGNVAPAVAAAVTPAKAA